MKRRERLTKIASMVQDIDENDDKREQIVDKIKTRWKDKLEGYTYLDDANKLVDYTSPGVRKNRYGVKVSIPGRCVLIKYVSLDTEKLSGGIMVDLKMDGSGAVDKIILKNTLYNFTLGIRPGKYYIFYKLRNKAKTYDERKEEEANRIMSQNEALLKKFGMSYDDVDNYEL